MKYYKTLKKYKASNVEFDIETETAWSYGWWNFYRDGVFNDTFYSTTTRRHQTKVKELMFRLGAPEPIITLKNTRTNLTDLPEALSHELDGLKKNLKRVEIKLNDLQYQDGVRGKSYKDKITAMKFEIQEFKRKKKEVLNESI